jgi:hypothetical protein
MPRVLTKSEPRHRIGSLVFLSLLAVANVAVYVVTYVHGMQLAVWLRPRNMALLWCGATIGPLALYAAYDWIAALALSRLVRWRDNGSRREGAYEPTIGNLTLAGAFKWTALLLYVVVAGAYIGYAVRNGGDYVVATTCTPDASCTEMMRWLKLNQSGSNVVMLALALLWAALTLYTSNDARDAEKMIAEQRAARATPGAPATTSVATTTTTTTPNGYMVSNNAPRARSLARARIAGDGGV